VTPFCRARSRLALTRGPGRNPRSRSSRSDVASVRPSCSEALRRGGLGPRNGVAKCTPGLSTCRVCRPNSRASLTWPHSACRAYRALDRIRFPHDAPSCRRGPVLLGTSTPVFHRVVIGKVDVLLQQCGRQAPVLTRDRKLCSRAFAQFGHRGSTLATAKLRSADDHHHQQKSGAITQFPRHAQHCPYRPQDQWLCVDQQPSRGSSLRRAG
jgi:hypothetical protein